MSEVEDRVHDTEVDRDASGHPTTSEVHTGPTPQLARKDGTNKSKSDTGVVGVGDNPGHNIEDGVDDSEAETLIQSPEKRRSIMDSAPSLPPPNGDNTSRVLSHAEAGATDSEMQSRKRKRSDDDGQERESSPNPSRRSSPLSSPVAFVGSIDSDSDHRSRRQDLKPGHVKSRRNGTRDRSPESETVAGLHGSRQRRPSDIISHKKDKHNVDSAERRETRSATYSRHTDEERSPSPQPIPRRDHRRGVSTQLTGHDFGVKRRGRPPLINTRRNRSAERAASVSSDDSNSPAPPRSAISKLTSHDHDTMSPAKTGPRKWRDKNGRTFLARACNNNDLESAKARLAERPEDLNWADNAGNTPLQIAALEGFVDIVKFLLDSNCDVDTRNIDRETPLIDAVENGHVEVIRLLLDYGANPRLGNAKGDEPYELVPQDDENYEEIRGMLAEAKERESRKHKAHEQVEAADRERGSSRAASAASPRDSPPIGPRSPPAFASSRRRTGRSESTRNDLLWQANTQENLTKLAGKGDVQGVASILNILQKAETESLIAAAKAGHEEVLQYLLGMGDPEPDPDPVRNLKPGYNTPMLAAIGRGHVDVVKLLVSQSGFNPTKKYKDKTYFELARERKGEDWQQEYNILKTAHDAYATSKGRKMISPRKARDAEKSKSRPIRRSSSPASHKRMSSSPTMTHKSLSSNKSSESSPMDKRKVVEGEKRQAAGVVKPDVGDNSVAVTSDYDQTVTVAKKSHRVRRSQSDLPPPQKLEPDAIHRRRRLVTGKEHRRNKSAAPESDSDGNTREVIVVKQEERPTPTLKRARSRSPMSPQPKQLEEVEKVRSGLKKRRTLLESSPDDGRHAPKTSNLMVQPEKSLSSEAPTQSIELPKQEEPPPEDTPMSNTDEGKPVDDIEAGEQKEPLTGTKVEEDEHAGRPDQPKHPARTEAANTPPSAPAEPSDAVRSNPVTEEKEMAERKAKEEAEEVARAEAERLAKAEADKAAAAAAAQAEAEAEAERVRVETARKAREEEERKIAEQKKAEEAEAHRKATEEALIRKKQEDERREQARREQQEQQERRRLEIMEQERQRREALPIVLSKSALMIDENDGSALRPEWFGRFLPLFTVQTKQLDPETARGPELVRDGQPAYADGSRDDSVWVANFQVAGVFATKDLSLRQYNFRQRECSLHERQCLWRVARNMLSFDYEANGINTSVKQATQRENENRPKFLAMRTLFWVNLSDVIYSDQRPPHLAGIDLRTQAISLASYASLGQQGTNSPQTNGISRGESKLANGIHFHSFSPENTTGQATT